MTLSTYATVSVPTSPTRPANPRFDQFELTEAAKAIVASKNVVCTLVTATAEVYISDNIEQTMAPRMPFHPYNSSSPVSIPYGGAGGSNGGSGGFGHAVQPPFPPVLDDVVSDIVAGSNGATGGEIVQQSLSLDWNCGTGGSGGGAIELIAVNDLIIGVHGGISADGMNGDDAFRAGGGGSGGTVLLSAGGVLVVHAGINTRGGNGGAAVGLGGLGGGGGGGGRIAAYAQSINIDGGWFNLTGGSGGLDQPRAPPAPTPYIGQIELFYPVKSFYNNIPRTASNINGNEGVLHMVSAGGARYKIDLAVRAQSLQPQILLLSYCQSFTGISQHFDSNDLHWLYT